MGLVPHQSPSETAATPAGWQTRDLGELITFQGGSQPDKSFFRPSPRRGYVRLIQIRDYKTNKYETYVPRTLVRKFCSAEDIMIGRYGPPVFQILRGLEGAYNVALIKATPSSEVDRNYAYYFLKQDSLFRFIDRLSRRTSGQTGVDLDELRAYPFLLPRQRAEQEAIAEALSDADALIESLERLIAKKRLIKQGAMQELLTGKRRLPGLEGAPGTRPTEVGPVPKDWSAPPLYDLIGSMRIGGAYKNSDAPTDWPLVKMGNLRRGSISLAKVAYVVAEQVPRGVDQLRHHDLLFNTRNTIDLVGKTALWRSELPRAALDLNIMRINFMPDQIANNEFMNYAMNTERFIRELRGVAIGTTSVAAIYGRDLVGLRIPLPPRPEQLAIAGVLSDMDSELVAVEAKLEKARMIKQGMMHNLLTGKIRLV